jgi:hypothetical protein
MSEKWRVLDSPSNQERRDYAESLWREEVLRTLREIRDLLRAIESDTPMPQKPKVDATKTP